jgi:hypothetical protein
MGLKALDPAVVETADDPAGASRCFLKLSRARFFAPERLVEAERASARSLAASAAYLRSERRTAACNSRSTNEQMLAETRPHSE